jgi:alpha-galactosidase
MKARWGLSLLLLSVLALGAAPERRVQPPPNEPGRLEIQGPNISLSYDDTTLFSGRILNPEDLRAVNSQTLREGDCVHQVVALYAKDWNKPVILSGTIEGTEEAFPCEADPRPSALVVVRHTSGLSRSRLNNAVYDRGRDSLVSVDDPWRTKVEIIPPAQEGAPRRFALRAEGNEIILRFRPRFYQRHRGLRWFEPWTYKVWPRSVAGWCSWFAFLDAVTEADMLRTAETFGRVMAPFGFEYLQMDDGYQRAIGPPSSWLVPNDKFPGGLASLARAIKDKGLRPGIWTSVGFADTAFALAHPVWFVRDEKGALASGNWVTFSLDGSNPAALNGLVRPLYRDLAAMGWEYYKLDTLRHLRYEGYNSHPEYFAARRVDRVAAFRAVVRAVRQEIGRQNFLLGCWGVRPELVGLIDACRLGTDGFSFAGLAQFNSFNNVVWRNDPDHIELSDREAYRSTAVTTLTGSLMMLTDKPERYLTAFAEPARRSAPVLFTLPGQVYDVDPSRSSEIGRVDVEVSGKEPKPFDAGLTPHCQLYALEVCRPFESWLVLGRTGGDFDRLRMADLGLDPLKEYFVFDFWRKRLLGSFQGTFSPGPIDPAFNCQVFIIRERLDRPQVLATNRHLTGGGVDLVDVAWTEGRLSGRSNVVGGDAYDIYLAVPEGFALQGFTCRGAGASEPEISGRVVRLRCQAETSGKADWEVRFERE